MGNIMLKNFLLSKVSVLILAAIVLHSLVAPAWSVKDEEENGSSAITIKNPHNDTEKDTNNGEGNNHLLPVNLFPNEIITHILTLAVFCVGEEKKDLGKLASVCRLWKEIVNNKNETTKHAIKKAFWRGWYDITNPQDIAIFDRFYKGVLIYRPIEGSDEGMIRLPISDLSNPLEGRFDLSQCGNAGQHLSIATGYRKVQTPANAEKVEIWFTPRFLVDKERETLAQNHHIKKVRWDWDAARAPVGIFWTWGGWDAAEQLSWGGFLTVESMVELGSGSLLKKYQDGRHPYIHDCRSLHNKRELTKGFTFRCEPK